MDQGIVAVHNAGGKAPRLSRGVYFHQPTEPCLGTFDGKPVHIVCDGTIENAGALMQRAGVTNFHSGSTSEVLLNLLKLHERDQHFFSALLDVIREVRGTYSLVAIREEELYAAHMGSELVAGSCMGALLVCTQRGAVSTLGGSIERILPLGEVLCQCTNRQPIFATPARPRYMRVDQGLMH